MPKVRPSIRLGQIPSMRDLCDLLGCDDTEAENKLRESSRQWRMAYTTSSGRPGTELLVWQSEQEELEIMAKAFLSSETLEFRPIVKGGDLMPNNSNERIVEILKQLFWKQNKYAANNAKYSQSSQRRIRSVGAIEYNDRRQIKRRERASDALIAYNHDRFMVLEPEQNPLSQQFSPAPSALARLHTDAAALPPTECQLPSQIQQAYITPQPKGCVLIPFFTSLYNNGITRWSFWEEGRFGAKSLKEFLPGLATKLECELNDIEKIKLVLRLKTLEFEFQMETKNEVIWKIAMATFEDEIKKAKTKGKLKGVNVFLEPTVMRKDSAETGGWNEDEEFEL